VLGASYAIYLLATHDRAVPRVGVSASSDSAMVTFGGSL
jgi:hypothetical protein